LPTLVNMRLETDPEIHNVSPPANVKLATRNF
jgi:hypothetical protein